MRLRISYTGLALVFVSASGLLPQAEWTLAAPAPAYPRSNGSGSDRAVDQALAPSTRRPTGDLAISSRHSPAVGHSKAPLSFLSPTERDIVAETNKVRRDPAGYAAELEGWRGRFKENRIELPASDIRIRSQEGLAALEDAIHALRRSRPAPPLAVSKGMTLAARAHLRDMAGSGKFRHRGTDGSEVVERLRRYGTPKKTAGENLMAGVGDGREVVAALLIDDGVPSRGHRSNILDREFRATGVACGPHPRYRVMCVIAYAGGFVE
ncbi:MAG: CAP domain-containing protein [Acidobacteria bacterium]|nr:MAG: CAP domain-containing protein [Acidobacteriota bacterium]